MRRSEMNAICGFCGLVGDWIAPMECEGQTCSDDFKRGWAAALKELPELLGFYVILGMEKKSSKQFFRKHGIPVAQQVYSLLVAHDKKCTQRENKKKKRSAHGKAASGE